MEYQRHPGLLVWVMIDGFWCCEGRQASQSWQSYHAEAEGAQLSRGAGKHQFFHARLRVEEQQRSVTSSTAPPLQSALSVSHL
jgi:hypothetical protein